MTILKFDAFAQLLHNASVLKFPNGSSVRACCMCKRVWVGVRRGKDDGHSRRVMIELREPLCLHVLERCRADNGVADDETMGRGTISRCAWQRLRTAKVQVRCDDVLGKTSLREFRDPYTF